MGVIKDLKSQIFGRLTVISYNGLNNDHKATWLCKCDCGSECIVVGKNLLSGRTKSCGCFRKEVTRKRATIHGDTRGGNRSKLHSTLHGMKYRCYNPNCSEYKDYGGRGISVCDEWLNDYQSFKEWALNNGYHDDLTIERIDVNGNYCPENCTWIPLKDQSLNTTRSVKYLGLCESEWANRLGIHHSLLGMYRKRKNCSLEKAVRYYICKNYI